ncbi:major tail protein [Paenilisteria newyorkensis]|uniref:major tail protein n=1 Tax=Listeria newyorkensis TaxID=1497681 RepID=UPI000669BE82|nr:major tail protein [Listeria newyorkensis]KMT58899.1 major tail protein [Listeria newyorkensis]
MVKIGLDKAQYGVHAENEEIKEIKNLKGLVTAKLNVSQESEPFFADDGIYDILDGGINDLGLDFDLADILSDAKKDILGVEIEDGMEIYNKDIKSPYVAVSFRSKMTNGKYVWFGLAKGKFTLPSVDLKTKEDKLSPATDAISGSFAARERDGLMMTIAREDNEGFSLEKFYKKVYGIAPSPEVVEAEETNIDLEV